MTPHFSNETTVSTQELIELAVLDAFGLLETHEQDAFERTFSLAPPSVQAQIRRQQTRLARDESLLPHVAPSPELRAAVLDAVRRAMANTHDHEMREAVLARVGAAVAADARSREPKILRSHRVSPFWRAAALGLAASAVVFGVATLQMRSEIDRLAHAVESDSILAAIHQNFGSDYMHAALLDRNTQRVVFDRVANSTAQASLWINPDWSEAQLFYLDLPADADARYRLVALDDQGNVREELATINSTGGLGSHRFKLATGTPMRLAILPASGGPGDALLVCEITA
ncbi:MAG: hypothetical protein RBS39_07010 [Phycisphaerales bacterium]|jgi:anti-sigma-K factor RskA|nr:hypothetical protein [Phycisphaerales bacterium]